MVKACYFHFQQILIECLLTLLGTGIKVANGPCPMEVHSSVDLTTDEFDLKFKPSSFNSTPDSLSTTFHKFLVTESQWAEQNIKDMR